MPRKTIHSISSSYHLWRHSSRNFKISGSSHPLLFLSRYFFTFLFIFHPFLANDFILNRLENILKTFINLLVAFSIILTDAFSNKGCVKSVHMRSYFGPHLSRIFPYLDWIRRDTSYLSIFSPNAGNAGKIRTRITLNTNTSYAVKGYLAKWHLQIVLYTKQILGKLSLSYQRKPSFQLRQKLNDNRKTMNIKPEPRVGGRQSIDLLRKRMVWFLYDMDLHHERVNALPNFD